MKTKFTAGLVAAFAAIALAGTLSGASAADKPFSFTVEGTTLHIFGPDGQEIGTGLPPATIAKTVDAPPYSFQVSFGSDANGNLSVIVTPNPEHPTPLNFVVNNRSVQMDRSSVVTITLGNNGATTIDPGSTGAVKVDNHTTVAAPVVAAATTTAPANSPNTPSQNPEAAAAAGTTPANNNPSNLGTALNNPLAADPTAAPSAFINPSSQATFNASQQAVAANSPTTSPSPTTPF